MLSDGATKIIELRYTCHMGRRFLKFLLIAGLLFWGNPAFARQDDPKLDDLFGQLSETKDIDKAKVIEGSIWKIWLTSGSDTVDFLMLQGISYMSQGQFAKAITLFSTVIKIDPEFSEGWNKRATVLFLIGEYDSSIEDIGRTLELEPRHFGALSGLGQIYDLKKSEEGALSAYEKAVAINPHLPSVKARLDQLIIERDKKRI
ncbi:tetratricopeptide repeat protein [Sneathiella sp. HT1-7]|uniref:tetratricopeptide repeat protein n=1 Tax=Sneathiella sp. HT1-7 TaxID=2887192 RepID=UPI001D14988A|nr:tetratricopeptide repeat protein [Sneathiella sp. HT1-7]MCC3305564.1 tetratricopeptide repeat protein [Sneathiella sp. HT1-7]